MASRKTPVIFRKWKPRKEFDEEGGDIIALFPTELGTNDPYTCSSYEHVGQHGSADPVGVIQATKPAKPAEYADLLKELHRIGYRNLDIRQKLLSSYLEERRRLLDKFYEPKPVYSATRKPKTKRRTRSKSKSSSPSGDAGIRMMRG